MENQQKEIFANCSQTHFAMRKFRRPISQCENSPTQIRNAKISQCEISQCQMPFRNAKIDFAMPISNFAMRKFSQYPIRNAKISQCENSQCENFAKSFRSAKFNFAMPNHYSFVSTYAKFRIAKFTTTLRNFANPFRIAKFTLRNFLALSSFVINAEPPSIFGVLLFCPLT